MHILIVSATHFELKPLLDLLRIDRPERGMNTTETRLHGHRVDVLITGIGMVNTAFMMGRYAGGPYDWIINAGVCGAFDKSLALGEVVQVTEDILSEMGAEDGDLFLTYDQMQLPGVHVYRASSKNAMPQLAALPAVKGITVNTVHGQEASIEKVEQLYRPDVESMEGAAFFAACEGAENTVQIRSISNYVEKRDKSKWQMPLAIKNLNDVLMELIQTL